jgi:hypothetical protein
MLHRVRAILLVLTIAGLAPIGAVMIGGGCDPCPTCTHGATPSPTPPPESRTSSGQGLIAIDTTHNVAYVPIYRLDSNGDSELALVKLPTKLTSPGETAGATGLVEVAPLAEGESGAEAATPGPVIGVLSLAGVRGQHTIEPVACTFNPKTGKVFAEARQGDDSVIIYEIATKTRKVTNAIPATGITHSGAFGGIIANPLTDKVIVAGTDTIGILDSSTEPPTFDAASVVSVPGTDSIALNFKTNLLFISTDGTLGIIDTSTPIGTKLAFNSFNNTGFGTTDGVSFDSETNILIMSQEVGGEPAGERAFAFNFDGITATSMTAPEVTIHGLGEVDPIGEGPGGQAVVNLSTHQAVIADEFGQNFWLVHMPQTPITGAPDNNGQPGSGTTADDNSVFTIANAVIPQGVVNGQPTQLVILGDPNSLSVDPVHNILYVLADTIAGFHSWQGGTTTPLFLVGIDLSSPVLGANPSPTQKTHWIPNSITILMPAQPPAT